MIIIKHRINSVKDLVRTPNYFGVEIDLRSNNKDIYLHHDPFKKGVLLDNWIKYYKHKFIVLNVKEEGLEKEILKTLKKNNIKNFFFHDQSFSSLLKNMNKTKVSLRYSEYEDLKNTKFLFKKVKWIWIDNFNEFPLKNKFYKYLKKRKVKICLVSPELVKENRILEIKKIIKFMKKNKIKIDAVCTKNPNLWKKLSYTI